MKPKQIIITVIAAVLVILATIATVRSCDKAHPVEHNVYITDTITSIQCDTVLFKETVFEKLKTTDTVYIVRDSLLVRVDSVNVEVPVSEYIFNEVFENDSSRLEIGMTVSGHNVKIDTIAYTIKYTYAPVVMVKKNFFKDHFRAGIGISGGYGIINKKADIYVGAGFYFVF